MDKFGIFNLLSSFFSQNSFGENSKPNQTNSLSPLLTNLLSSLSANDKSPDLATKNQNQSTQKTESEPKISVKPPLQDQMLKTMLNHDKFVEKVKKANPVYKI